MNTAPSQQSSRAMWTRMLWGIAVFLLPFLGCWLLWSSVVPARKPPPSEQELLAIFTNHRANFRLLQEVFSTNYGQCQLDTPNRACLPQHQRAMKTIQVQKVSWGKWNNAVWFDMYAEGSAPTSSTRKGYVYFDTAPEADMIVPALDDLKQGPKRIRFRWIEAHWYLYLLSD